MRAIISYDISSDKRRRKVVKRLKRCAMRVQFSVFEGDLTATGWDRVWRDLNELINPALDGLMLVYLCGGCGQKRRESGTTGRRSMGEDTVV